MVIGAVLVNADCGLWTVGVLDRWEGSQKHNSCDI